MIGYSLSTARRNAQADQTKLGVRIGKYCIANNIPVEGVAAAAGVSRTAVYDWFCGAYSPRPKIAEVVAAYLSTYSAK
jgi:hypothetical protein